MGTLIVHRLINANDREVVEKASGDLDKAAARFLPTLTPGEALIVGVGFPMPLAIQIAPPKDKPHSEGAQYQECWKEPVVSLLDRGHPRVLPGRGCGCDT
jgi:uncharacterized protein